MQHPLSWQGNQLLRNHSERTGIADELKEEPCSYVTMRDGRMNWDWRRRQVTPVWW